MIHSMSSVGLRAGWRAVVGVAVLFTVGLVYMLPWPITVVIVVGLLIGWAISRLLESLS